MTPPRVAVFAMAERGHFRRLLPIIDDLRRAGARVDVYTDGRWRGDVERAGGAFFDLFADGTVNDADASSIPVPCRFVTFAARFADAITARVAARRPAIVLHDTFAVIGLVVATRLVLPRVNVCAGHNLAPAATVEALQRDPRVDIADVCHAAAATLASRDGVADASPFSYVTGVSPWLNLYCEPPQFLRPDERAPFEPIAFFGSLWPSGHPSGAEPGPRSWLGHDHARRLYVSFGTVVWRYFGAAAHAALAATASLAAAREDLRVVVGLGDGDGSAPAARLAAPRFHVEPYAAQWEALRHASAYLTHHGLNSTHEAIYHRVPMLSYPFFADQPGLARRCQELGLALPIVDDVQAPLTTRLMAAALRRLDDERPAMAARLTEAHDWERDTIAGRAGIIARVLSLAT